MKIAMRNQGKLFLLGFLIFSLYSLSIPKMVAIQSINASSNVNSDPNPVSIVQNPIPLFGGVNSISVNLKNSSLGILYGTDINPFPPTLFTKYQQSLAELEIFNRRGTIVNRTELITQNLFAVQLERIVEYDTQTSNRRFNPVQTTEIKKIIDLSLISFELNNTQNQLSESNAGLSYSIDFIATNLSYHKGDQIQKLDSLVLSFDFTVEKSIVNTTSVPKVRVQPQGTQLSITRTSSDRNIEAVRFSPRLKFSCNIKGWNFSTPTSKLLLKVKFLSHEMLIGLNNRVSNIPLNRESFSDTELLGRLIYSTDRNGSLKSYTLDQESVKNENYSADRFHDYHISFGNSFRDFLNFTWGHNLSVDGSIRPITFQPLSAGILSNTLNTISDFPSQTLFLNAGFVFPQGEDLQYDPELQVEELNPILTIISPPNRVLLESSSQVLLVSGFFIGVLIIFNVKIRK
ncbi:MAG: hypothetical protein ACW99F_18455 [Candidatus Hodarchaeales archaeon]|jgi:hypothetical protein